MKFHYEFCLGLLVAVLAEPCLAGDQNAAYCEKQARDITRQIVQSVLPDLSADQRAHVQAATDQACMQLVAHDPALANSVGKSASTDWFTNYILHGKHADKPGNKRLEHLK